MTLGTRAKKWRDGILATMELGADKERRRKARAANGGQSFDGMINGFRCRVVSAGTAAILLGKRWVEVPAGFGGFQRALEGVYLLTDTLKRSPTLLAEMAASNPITNRRPAMAKTKRRKKAASKPAPKSKAKAPATKPAAKKKTAKRADSKVVHSATAKGKSLMTFAREILKKAKEPMGCQAIVDLAIKGGWKTGGKTPAATLYSSFLRDIKLGKAATIAKAGRGVFKLRAA